MKKPRLSRIDHLFAFLSARVAQVLTNPDRYYYPCRDVSFLLLYFVYLKWEQDTIPLIANRKPGSRMCALDDVEGDKAASETRHFFAVFLASEDVSISRKAKRPIGLTLTFYV